MAKANLWDILTGIPKLIVGQTLHPLRRTLRGSISSPETQSELADLVNRTRKHEIRAGYTHRFITLMFVTVGGRVFCRQYQFSQRSWRSVFLDNPEGQVRLYNTVINIDARVPQDFEDIIPAVDKAYADTLRKIGASFMLSGAVTAQAQESTMEIFFAVGCDTHTGAET